MHTLNQFQRQALSSLTPGGIGEFYSGQMSHCGTCHIAMGDLLDKKFERISRRERRVTKGKVFIQRQLIDAFGYEMMIQASANIG